MLRLVDISRYQVDRADPIDLAKAKAAGYSIVNVALTGGRGYVSGSWASTYLNHASALGLGRSAYHWLDGRTSGAFQATAQLARLKILFGPALTGFAHFVDVEEGGKNGITPPTWAHVRDYVTTMQAALGRPICIYSADYWWQPKGWNGAGLTPYLMGPPNSPVSTYPGDNSPAWHAGWGGWGDFSVMQWGVQPLPGTGDCSLSVIRDHSVWDVLTGGSATMANSQNGWPVVGQSAVTDRAVHGAEFPNGWLKGDVDTVFTYLIDRLHREVESVDAGGCWGWYVKPIEGSAAISNHSSGTAIDYNAPNHPMGVRNTYSAADRDRIHAILDDLGGVVRWGGDYTGRPDDMHFEINASRAAVARVAERIRDQEDDMALTEAQTKQAAKDAIVEVFAEAYQAAIGNRGTTSAADKAARNYRDFLRGVVGGPVEASLSAAAVAEAARDATQSAQIAQMLKMVETLAASSGAFTPEDFDQLKSAMSSAAAQAGGEAADRVEAKLDSLREHLGDDDPALPPA